MKQRKILAISGSTKKRSTSLSMLQFIAEAFKDRLELTIFNEIARLPHFNPELENENLPIQVTAFRKAIETADGVVFCTPEYVFSLPGSLKNAIEWTVSTTLFSSKPVAVIVAAASGEKAFESLSLILTTIESILPNESKLLIGGAKGKLDAQGSLVDQETQNKIKQVMESLIQSIEKEDQKPTKYA